MDMTPLEYGVFSLNERKRECKVGDEAVCLTPTSFKLLAFLMARAPQVVTFEELLEQVWKPRVVGRETVKQQVKTLRQQLGSQAHMIESVRGVGYRLQESDFPSEINRDDSFNNEESTGGNQKVIKPRKNADLSYPSHWLRSRARVAIALGGVSTLLFAWYLSFQFDSKYRSPADIVEVTRAGSTKTTFTQPIQLPLTIAILPFTYLDSSQIALPLLLQDELITEISRLQDIRVLSVSAIKNAVVSPLRINDHRLNYPVDMLLEGSIRDVEKGQSVNIRLVYIPTGLTVWRDTIKLPSDDREGLLQAVKGRLSAFLIKKTEYLRSR